MPVRQDGYVPSACSIPPRTSSLSETIGKTGQHNPSTHFFDSGYITWPAPKSRYLPLEAPSHDAIEPFPDLPLPSDTLIIARTLLLGDLWRGGSSKGARRPGRRFDSLYSRIAPSTGHIKEHEDLTRCCASVEHIFESAQGLLARRKAGNSAKLVRLRGTYPDMYASRKDPEPEQILKMRLKAVVKARMARALAMEREVGSEHNHDQARRGNQHGSIARRDSAAPAVPSARTNPLKAVQNLVLRETHPTYYKPDSLTAEAHADRKGKAPLTERNDREVLKGSRVALVPFDNRQHSRPVPSDGGECPASQPLSHKSLRPTASMSSLQSMKQTTASILRRMATKVGVQCSSDSEHTDPPVTAAMEVDEKRTVRPAVQRVNEQILGIDSFPVAVRTRAKSNQAISTARTLATKPSKDALKRHGRFFVIERGMVHGAGNNAYDKDVYVSAPGRSQQSCAPLTTPMIKRGRPRGISEAPSASPKEDELTTGMSDTTDSGSSCTQKLEEPACAQIVSFSRPPSQPRLVSIPAGKKRVQHSEPQATPNPTPVEVEASSSLSDEWVIVPRLPARQADNGNQPRQQKRHAFRGYLTRPHPLGRPQSMMELSQSYLEQSHGVEVSTAVWAAAPYSSGRSS